MSVLHWLCLMHLSDRMAEMIKEELDVKDCKITSTVVEDACFVNIPEDQIKLENTEIKGNLDKYIFSLWIEAHFVFKGGGGVDCEVYLIV